jgi:hypothetical protein
LLYSIKLIIAYLCSSIKIKKIKFLSKLEMILDRKAEFGRAADLKKSHNTSLILDDKKSVPE